MGSALDFFHRECVYVYSGTKMSVFGMQGTPDQKNSRSCCCNGTPFAWLFSWLFTPALVSFLLATATGLVAYAEQDRRRNISVQNLAWCMVGFTVYNAGYLFVVVVQWSGRHPKMWSGGKPTKTAIYSERHFFIYFIYAFLQFVWWFAFWGSIWTFYKKYSLQAIGDFNDLDKADQFVDIVAHWDDLMGKGFSFFGWQCLLFAMLCMQEARPAYCSAQECEGDYPRTATAGHHERDRLTGTYS